MFKIVLLNKILIAKGSDKMEKPQKLYRGIILTLNEFKNYDFNKDITVHYNPIINNSGMKTVSDGNEYGVYMTSNKNMTLDIYGYAHNNDIPLVNDVKLERNTLSIASPMIGIAYEIDTNGIEIREPWMTQTLSGVANNGYEGDEWIADKIPANNYKVIRIHIGEDILHDDVFFQVDNNLENVRKQVIKIIEERNKRLLLFADILRKNKYLCSRTKYSIEIVCLSKILKIGGLIDKVEHNISTKDGLIDSMEQFIYDNNPNNIIISKFIYIENLRTKLLNVPNEESFNIIMDLLIKDKLEITNKIMIFTDKAILEGREYNDQLLRDKINLIDGLIGFLINFQNKNISKKL